MGEVTTAARRIVRAVNREKPGWRFWFDLDGTIAEKIYDPEGRCCGPLPDNAWVARSRRPGERLTERGVQDFLDAVHDARPYASGRNETLALANALVSVREGERERVLTVEQEIAALREAAEEQAREDDDERRRFLAQAEADDRLGRGDGDRR